MIIQTLKIVTKIILSIGFGILFWWFMDNYQNEFVNWKASCCMRCGNILFDREQPVLAVCAGLAALILSFLEIRSWKVVLVTIAVAFLSFYPYWAFTYWTGHPRQECTALNYPKGVLPFANEITMYLISAFWASICAVSLLVLQGIREVITTIVEGEEVV